MKSCEKEPLVVQWLRSSVGDESVERHIESCPDCLMLVRMYRELHGMASTTALETALPSHREILIAAELQRSTAAMVRRRKRDAWLRWSMVTGLVAGTAGILRWIGQQPSHQDWSAHPIVVPVVLLGILGLLEWMHRETLLKIGGAR